MSSQAFASLGFLKALPPVATFEGCDFSFVLIISLILFFISDLFFDIPRKLASTIIWSKFIDEPL